MAIEILTAVLVGVLAVVSVAAALVGIAGAFGIVRTNRCDCCGRFSITVAGPTPTNCVNCRHERILHPVAVLHRMHAEHALHRHAA